MTSTLPWHGLRRSAQKSLCHAIEIHRTARVAQIIGRFGFVISTVTKLFWRVLTEPLTGIGGRDEWIDDRDACGESISSCPGHRHHPHGGAGKRARSEWHQIKPKAPRAKQVNDASIQMI